MRKKTNLILSVLVLCTLGISLPVFFTGFNDTAVSPNGVTFLTASYVPNELPIDINGEGALSTYFAPSPPAGTEGDPYIFEDLIIDGVGGPCIRLRHTTSYIIIRNCILYNADDAIYLHDVNNILITNCTIDDIECGVYCDSATSVNNVNITNNIVIDVSDLGLSAGFFLNDITDGVISGNTVSDGDPEFGIRLGRSENVRIVGNTINQSYYGIAFWADSDITILSNTILNCSSGICSISFHALTNIVISDNYIYNAIYGIDLKYVVSGIDVYHNTINYNTSYGIYSLTQNCTFRSNIIQDTLINGIYVNGTNTTVILNQINSSTDGIYIDSSENKIYQNTISNTENGIYVNNYTQDIDGNFISISNIGIYVNNSGVINITNNQIDVSEDGIFLDTCGAMLIAWNVIFSDGIGIHGNMIISTIEYNEITAIKSGISLEDSGFASSIIENTILVIGEGISGEGIYLNNCGGMFGFGIYNNTILQSIIGILIEDSDPIYVENNSVSFALCGILLNDNSDNINLEGNTISWNGTFINTYIYMMVYPLSAPIGVFLEGGLGITAIRNEFIYSSFFIDYDFTYDDANNYTILDNTMNGQPIYCLSSQDHFDLTQYLDFGQLLLFNMTNIEIPSGTTAHGTNAITLFDCDFVGISDVHMDGFTYNGIYVVTTNHITVADSSFSDIQTDFYGYYTDDVEITNCQFSDPFEEYDEMYPVIFDTDIIIMFSDRISLEGNTFEYGMTGLVVMGCTDVTIDSNTFTDIYFPIYTLGGLRNVVSNNILSISSEWYIAVENHLYGFTGIILAGNLNSSASGNTITGYTHGIGIESGNQNLTVEDNTLVRSGISFIVSSYFSNYNWKSAYLGYFNVTLSGNTVNGKPVYFYVDENDLGSSDFANAGQIILINCNDSVINGLTFEDTSVGIYMFHCYGTTISENIFMGLYQGIRMDGSFDSIVYYNHFEKNVNHVTNSYIKQSIESELTNLFYNPDTNEGNYYWDYAIRYPFATNDGNVWNQPYFFDPINENAILTFDLYPLVESKLIHEVPVEESTWWIYLLIVLGSIAGGIGGTIGLQYLLKKKASTAPKTVSTKKLSAITNQFDCKMMNGKWKNGICSLK